MFPFWECAFLRCLLSALRGPPLHRLLLPVESSAHGNTYTPVLPPVLVHPRPSERAIHLFKRRITRIPTNTPPAICVSFPHPSRVRAIPDKNTVTIRDGTHPLARVGGTIEVMGKNSKLSPSPRACGRYLGDDKICQALNPHPSHVRAGLICKSIFSTCPANTVISTDGILCFAVYLGTRQYADPFPQAQPPAICVSFRLAPAAPAVSARRIGNAYSHIGQRTEAPRIAS